MGKLGVGTAMRMWTAALAAAVMSACGGGNAPEPPHTNEAPVAIIESPLEGATFRAGEPLAVVVRGEDLEDGTLGPDRLTWWIELHHDTHTHPFHPETRNAGATVPVPARGETSSNIFYRLHARAVDSAGNASAEVTRDVVPQKVQLTFQSTPAGVPITLDGQVLTGATTITGVVGIERDLAAVDQALNGRRYRFESWSDGGAASHTISTPAADTTYTATFVDDGPVANQPPSVIVLIGPSTGTVGVPVTMSASAIDLDDGVAKVELLVGGTVVATDASDPYALPWTPTSAGTFSLVARATDVGGLSATSAAATVVVQPAGPGDTQPPSVTLVTPADFAAGLTGTVSMSATATDDVGVTGVEFQVDGVSVGSLDTSPPYEASVDTTQHASGQHVVRARARDAAGNWSAWAGATVSFGGSRDIPPGFAQQGDWVIGLTAATRMVQAPDGRFFVAEQGGALRVVKGGVLLPTPFVTLPVVNSGEHGLVGVALHPDFDTNGFVYVYYTTSEGGKHNRISRLKANGDVAQAASEERLIDLPVLSAAEIHDGGSMAFGNDGKLYVGVGENQQGFRAQNTADPLGKILRFNEDGSIPADNPFCQTAGDLKCAVWAYGLRNPFTLAKEPGTGRMFIGEVGQFTWEEIDLAAPRANFGWPASEGPDNITPGVTAPLFTYRHGATDPPGTGPGGFFNGYAITAGAFYPAGTTLFPAPYRNSFYFADYVTLFIGRLDLSNGFAAYSFGKLSGAPVGMLVGIDGALYFLTRTNIIRIAPQ